jgi:hypothetical protein
MLATIFFEKRIFNLKLGFFGLNAIIFIVIYSGQGEE